MKIKKTGLISKRNLHYRLGDVLDIDPHEWGSYRRKGWTILPDEEEENELGLDPEELDHGTE